MTCSNPSAFDESRQLWFLPIRPFAESRKKTVGGSMNLTRAFSRRLCTILIVGVSIVSFATPQASTPETPIPTSLAWYASLAKARHQSSIVIGTSENHDYTPSLLGITKSSLLVKGLVVTATTDYSDGFKIYQWYRIKMLDKGPEASQKDVVVHTDIPRKLGSSKSDELVLRVDGGTATIDGVTIVQPGPPPLTEGKEFLFFLKPTNEAFYHLSFNTRPILLDAQGNFESADADSSSTFLRRVRRYHSFSEIKQFATDNK